MENKNHEVTNKWKYFLYKSGLTGIWHAIKKFFLEHQMPIHIRRPLKKVK